MYVHRDQRRNSQPKTFHESSELTLLPPRPRSSGHTGLSSRSELLGLQVRGFCCPLQQRPSSGRTTHRVSRGGGGGSLTLLNSLTGRLESGEKTETRSMTGSIPEAASGGGESSMCPRRDSVSETAETPTTPCMERPGLHAQPGAATKMSELHLYLPSSLSDDEEQDVETAEMRTSAEDTNPLVFPKPPHTHQDETHTGPTLHPTPPETITEEDPEHS
ncbi:uncharacterized protein LOC117818634 [Notolabrus celidotus]|uniref:uncharacterized protein LOC117818634 n=1 Tax=Notolabrus celidotus TaxID=1203425 RepID=UPI001490801A|nr:uncharacterized protein LOC117818634 [Notolabrus celidotus]